MSVFRKENGSLVKKAGRALVDLALSLTSNNAVANSAVTEKLQANDGLVFDFTKSGTAYGYKDGDGNFVPFKNPTGTKSITANGTYDVTDYASAEVNVSNGGRLVGTYYSDTTIDISAYANKSTSRFIAVANGGSASGTTVNNYQIYSREHCDVTFTAPSISISGNNLTLSVGRLSGTAYVEGYGSNPANASSNLTTKLYYLGD